MVLYVSEIIAILIVVSFVLTQVAVPLWRNTLLFPVFHKGREKKLETDLKTANQEIENLKLQLEIKMLREMAEEMRHDVQMQTKEPNGATVGETEN